MSVINLVGKGVENLASISPLSWALADYSSRYVSKAVFETLLLGGRQHLAIFDSPKEHHGFDLIFNTDRARKELVKIVEEKQLALPLLFPYIDIGYKYNMDSLITGQTIGET